MPDKKGACVMERDFVSLARRLEDRALLRDQNAAAAAVAAVRNALQVIFANHSSQGKARGESRDEIASKMDSTACAFLNASPSLNILDVFDTYAKGNTYYELCSLMRSQFLRLTYKLY